MSPICKVGSAAAILAVGFVACTDDTVAPVQPPFELEAAMSVHFSGPAPPPPAGMVSVSAGGANLELWPWTGRDLSGEIADPMNILFMGDVDLVSLRAALMSLDGNRMGYGFPASFPFNCTWTDAHGETQSAYSTGNGWVANPVQLQCGSYDLLRFHIRFFDAGDWVMAGTHFDLLIPNTAEHQVISWELAQQLVFVDFLRSGLLDLTAPFSFVSVNVPGAVQAIPAALYNGIPDPLKIAVGLPPGPTTVDVPIPNDGLATILNLGTRAPVPANETVSDFTMNFNQVIPRPFCSQGPIDYVLLQGPLRLTTRTRVNGRGMLETHNTLRGELDVTPFDILTGMPSGPTFRAQISEIDNTSVSPNGSRVNAVLQRKALPPGVGQLKTHLVTGPNGAAHFTYSEKCG